MRILIAQINHETNTFSPLPTPLAAFRPLYGDQALAAAKGKRTPIGAFVDWAERHGHDLVCPVMAHAWPSGPLEDSVFDQLCDRVLHALDSTIDLVLLDLHGAMVVQNHADGEGELLARLRAKRPDIVIGLALDLHTQLSARMVALSDAITGYLSYPHIDMYETGERLCRLIEARLAGKPLTMKHLTLPIIAHTLPMNSTVPGVMRDMLDAVAHEAKAQGIRDISLFGGFPASDTLDTGMALLGVADAGADLDGALHRLAAQIWERRAEFVYQQLPLDQSLALAAQKVAAQGSGPVLLLDHGDNCMSGGTCDNIDILARALDQGFDDLLAGPIHDPQVVAQAFAAGDGMAFDMRLGNKIRAKNFAPPAPPLARRAKVLRLGDGNYTVSGPIYTGMACQMGRVALLEVGGAKILVAETPHEPWDLAIFTSLGLDPAAQKVLLLKSRMYCRPVFEPIAKAVVECAGGGVTGSDFRLFEFKNLRRPIYPLDAGAVWKKEYDAVSC